MSQDTGSTDDQRVTEARLHEQIARVTETLPDDVKEADLFGGAADLSRHRAQAGIAAAQGCEVDDRHGRRLRRHGSRR